MRGPSGRHSRWILAALLAPIVFSCVSTLAGQIIPPQDVIVLSGIVTMSTTTDGRRTYITLPAQKPGQPLRAGFVVQYFPTPPSPPFGFDGQAKVIFGVGFVMIKPVDRLGWLFKLPQCCSALPSLGSETDRITLLTGERGATEIASNLLTVGAVGVEHYWWEPEDVKFPATHEEFVKWHEEQLKHLLSQPVRT
jgi:hypothetical protein